MFSDFLIQRYRARHGEDAREGLGAFAGTIGLCANLFLSFLKLAAGFLSHSVSVVAEAVNNLSDAGASVVTLVGFRMAQKPADREHPYGHARIEYMSGAVIGIAVLLVGVELFKSSVEKILAPEAADFSAMTFVVLAVSILLKLWMRGFYRKTARTIQSSSLDAAADDSRNDIITSTAVLLSSGIEFFFHVRIDGWVGAGVAVFILVSGIGILRDASSPLLGEAPSRDLHDRLRDLILSHEGVLGYHDLLIHSYGPSQLFATVHVEMAAKDDPLHSHGVLDHIERDARRDLGVNLVIHLDPVATDDERLAELRAQLGRVIAQIDPTLSFHDLRVVRTHDHTNLVFDVALPGGYSGNMELLRHRIAQSVQSTIGPDYFAIPDFDRNYESTTQTKG